MTLYIVPTPLGNLSDITLRAIDALKQADLIACEDTRRTLKLLNHLGFSKPLWSYHAHSNIKKLDQILHILEGGKSVALVSDAGTPGLSDPGTPLVQAAIRANIPVVSLPGPCAAITGLVASGLPTDRLFFIGFLPRRAARAKRVLKAAAMTDATVAIYESPYRTAETLQWIAEVIGPDTPVVIGRELTKIHEEYIRGTAMEIAARLVEKPPLGEIVIYFKGVVGADGGRPAMTGDQSHEI